MLVHGRIFLVTLSHSWTVIAESIHSMCSVKKEGKNEVRGEEIGMRGHVLQGFKRVYIYSSSLPTSSSRKLSENPEISYSLARSSLERAFCVVLLQRRFRAFACPRHVFLIARRKLPRSRLAWGHPVHWWESAVAVQESQDPRHREGSPQCRTWFERSTRVGLVSSCQALSHRASPFAPLRRPGSVSPPHPFRHSPTTLHLASPCVASSPRCHNTSARSSRRSFFATSKMLRCWLRKTMITW